MEAEFLAIALVLVYVGAVMVLFMFVVMMLDINIEETKKRLWQNYTVCDDTNHTNGNSCRHCYEF